MVDKERRPLLQQQSTGFMGNVGVIMRNASTKNTKTEATNCLDHALVFLAVITESCHKQSDSDILVLRSKDAFLRGHFP